MRKEIKLGAEELGREAEKLMHAIAEHNVYLDSLEKKTVKVEQRSVKLSQKLLRSMKELREDGRNTIIVALTVTSILLLFYLL
ncbi:hypothetical protein NECID01_0721 [Nematocida sp. AWRm77]|nr:hypothetical protein NECID01_0721 [Nematocida sp. AWRm77]